MFAEGIYCCMQSEACSCGLIAALVAMLKADDPDCQAAAAALLHVLAAATQVSRSDLQSQLHAMLHIDPIHG